MRPSGPTAQRSLLAPALSVWQRVRGLAIAQAAPTPTMRPHMPPLPPPPPVKPACSVPPRQAHTTVGAPRAVHSRRDVSARTTRTRRTGRQSQSGATASPPRHPRGRGGGQGRLGRWPARGLGRRCVQALAHTRPPVCLARVCVRVRRRCRAAGWVSDVTATHAVARVRTGQRLVPRFIAQATQLKGRRFCACVYPLPPRTPATA